MVRSAFSRMAEHIDARSMACDPDNKDQAQRLIITKQILAGIKREFERMILEGEAAQIKLSEMEKRRSVFRR